MAKFKDSDESTLGMVSDISSQLNLENYGVDFQPIFVEKSKEVISVKKASDVAMYLSSRPDLVLIIINEKCWDKVDEKTQWLWLRIAMEQVSYDTEKCKLNIGCPTIHVPRGLYAQQGETIVNACELQLHVMETVKDEEKAEKERLKEEKRKKKKKGGDEE